MASNTDPISGLSTFLSFTTLTETLTTSTTVSGTSTITSEAVSTFITVVHTEETVTVTDSPSITASGSVPSASSSSSTISPSSSLFSDLISNPTTTTVLSKSTPSATPALDRSKHGEVFSAGAITGVALGSLLVLAFCVGVVILVYRRRQYRHRMMTADDIPPLQYERLRSAGVDSDPISWNFSGMGEKKGAIILQAESPPESHQPSFRRSITIESRLAPTATQIKDVDQDDMRDKMVQMEATIGRMAEHMHRLESQLDWTGDVHSDTAPPPICVRMDFLPTPALGRLHVFQWDSEFESLNTIQISEKRAAALFDTQICPDPVVLVLDSNQEP
ncbi:hypothetical protein BDP27DRAFT_1426150 [Rhodocollybia butyracea]|uniref:Uncharacterized protein n=1 Tax=Rhodocollybia butyracea TaxID=206335 RepID=A0A9P5U2P2_9AGAR|nr:hypothetical protein BDP27DRAFT_1426150 [Rhodocollybia butyracea]